MRKFWLLRPKPHNIKRIREFRSDDIIAIGWPEVGPLEEKVESEIKKDVADSYLEYSPNQLGIATSTINRFVNEMRPKDIVVVPDGSDIYFSEITSAYYYDKTKSSDDLGYPHQRKVNWIKGPVKRNDIPEKLRESLRAPRTLADLSHHEKDILSYIGEYPLSKAEEIEDDNDFAIFDYPVRLNTSAKIKIPKDITKEEAIRLGDFVKTLHFDD